MTIKRVGLALIAALSLNGTAPAQTTESVPPAGGGFSPASPTNAGAVATAITVGWNNVHPTNCQLFYDGTFNWLFVFTAEGGYFYTASHAFQAVLAPACQTGNLVGFYVDSTTGHWSQILTFSYK